MATGDDMRQDKGAYDAPEVVNKIDQTLARFNEESEDSTPDIIDDSADNSDSTPVSKDGKDQKPAEEDDSTPIESDDDSADNTDSEPVKEPEKPAIPDNYYRAAIHQGWSAEQISKLYESDPDGTLKILEKTYNDVNNLSQQFAQLGRKAKELQNQSPAQPQPAQPEPKGFDAKKFKEMYEENPAEAMALALEVMQQKPQQVTQPVQQQSVQNQQDEWQERLAAVEQLNMFFGADDMKPFGEHYGVPKSMDWSDITAIQYANRQKVISRADEILSGAEFLGRDMTVREAVELAHMELTAPMLQQIVRQDLVKQVQKKAKGATLRPSKSKSKVSPKSGGKLDDAQVVANAEARLADLRSRGL